MACILPGLPQSADQRNGSSHQYSVDPQCSSAGVGSKLLQHGLSEVKKKGIKQIYHWVNTNNLLANKAAAKFNHTRVKIPGVAVPDGLPDFNLYIIPTDSLELDPKDRPL